MSQIEGIILDNQSFCYRHESAKNETKSERKLPGTIEDFALCDRLAAA